MSTKGKAAGSGHARTVAAGNALERHNGKGALKGNVWSPARQSAPSKKKKKTKKAEEEKGKFHGSRRNSGHALTPLPPLAQTSEAGNFNITLSRGVLYVGGVGSVQMYDAVSRTPLSKIVVAGNATRARPLIKVISSAARRLLMVVAGTAALLFANDDDAPPTPRVPIARLELGAPAVDFVIRASSDIAYVLCSDGLHTLTIDSTLTSATLNQVAYDAFPSDLGADIVLHTNERALYVAAVTGGLLRVYNVSGSRRATSPVAQRSLFSSYYPISLAYDPVNGRPDLMICGAIFGFLFVDISRSLRPRIVGRLASPYLNLVRFLPTSGTLSGLDTGSDRKGAPATPDPLRRASHSLHRDQDPSAQLNSKRLARICHVTFGPQNQLLAGSLAIRRRRSDRRIASVTYVPDSRIPIAFGRLPWDISVVPEDTTRDITRAVAATANVAVADAKCAKTRALATIIVSNSTSRVVSVASYR